MPVRNVKTMSRPTCQGESWWVRMTQTMVRRPNEMPQRVEHASRRVLPLMMMEMMTVTVKTVIVEAQVVIK